MRSRQSQPVSPLVLPVSALRGFVFPKSKRTVAVSLVASILLTVGGVEGVGRAGCGRERGGGNRMRLQCRQRTKMGRDWMEDAGCELHCGVAWALLPTPVPQTLQSAPYKFPSLSATKEMHGGTGARSSI